MQIKYPISNSVIIFSKQNPEKFVAVYRKENSQLICFPGGKLDLGEDAVTAIMRETYEETGLLIPADQFQPIYSGVCEGTKEYWVTAFIVEIDENIPLNSPEPEMRPFWTNQSYFMEHCSFPLYNKEVFNAFNKIKK